MDSVTFRRAVVELAAKHRVAPQDIKTAFCILGHCACSETPPPIPMVRAEMVSATPEVIFDDVHRGKVTIEAFGHSKEAVLAFFGWLEGYLPDYEQRRQEKAAQTFEEHTNGDTHTSTYLPE